MAAFYVVSAETPSYTAPTFALHQLVISMPPLVVAFHMVVRRGASFTDTRQGLLHLQRHLHHCLQHQVYSPHPHCRWHSGNEASSPTPTKHRRRKSTPLACPCTDEVRHHITCSCGAPTLGYGKTSCPVRRVGHFTGRVPTRRRPLHQPV